jgi:hypothetical protein
VPHTCSTVLRVKFDNVDAVPTTSECGRVRDDEITARPVIVGVLDRRSFLRVTIDDATAPTSAALLRRRVEPVAVRRDQCDAGCSGYDELDDGQSISRDSAESLDRPRFGRHVVLETGGTPIVRCSQQRCGYAAHSAVVSRAAGRLHGPDDAQVEPCAVAVGRRAIASVGHLTAGSPRKQLPARTAPDDRKRDVAMTGVGLRADRIGQTRSPTSDRQWRPLAADRFSCEARMQRRGTVMWRASAGPSARRRARGCGPRR